MCVCVCHICARSLVCRGKLLETHTSYARRAFLSILKMKVWSPQSLTLYAQLCQLCAEQTGTCACSELACIVCAYFYALARVRACILCAYLCLCVFVCVCAHIVWMFLCTCACVWVLSRV